MGHHWEENDYAGPNGSSSDCERDPTDQCGVQGFEWQIRKKIHEATEALDIWLMPRNYSYSLWSWPAISHLISLPIQPTVVVSHGPVKVYARPGHVLLSEKDFLGYAEEYKRYPLA